MVVMTLEDPPRKGPCIFRPGEDTEPDNIGGVGFFLVFMVCYNYLQYRREPLCDRISDYMGKMKGIFT